MGVTVEVREAGSTSVEQIPFLLMDNRGGPLTCISQSLSPGDGKSFPKKGDTVSMHCAWSEMGMSLHGEPR